MAIYEYKCRDCGTVSEVLVFSSDEKPTCKKCNSTDLEKLISGFSVSSPTPKNSTQGGCGSCSRNNICGMD